MTTFTPGQHVSWTISHGGTGTVCITAASTDQISYLCVDGVHETVEAGRYLSLADQTRNWRPATAAEAAAFEARYRPAPANWH